MFQSTQPHRPSSLPTGPGSLTGPSPAGRPGSPQEPGASGPARSLDPPVPRPRTGLALLLGLAASLWGAPGLRAEPAVEIAEQVAAALGGPPAVQEAAAALRERGPDVVMPLLEALDAGKLLDRDSAEVRLLDRVCAQRDCAASRLFWHTDLEAALAEARRLERPVLSLRMLGRLDEDLSCANSRFFRTALYPDPAVGRLLRERFVLHWQSVRPVPKLTVDFGDGRRLEGTVAGNSVHYVLDRHGRLVDALPGLYGPAVFAAELEAAAALAAEAGEVSEGRFPRWARKAHRQRVEALDAALEADLNALGRGRDAAALRAELDAFAAEPAQRKPPTAREAAVLATSKAVSELPALALMDGGMGLLEPPPGERFWPALADLRREGAVLSPESQGLLLRLLGPGSLERFVLTLSTFQRTLAVDTARNQHLLRRTLHIWLGDREAGLRPEAFDQQVYARLFRTPLSDPWFGLAPADVFRGLEALGPQPPAAPAPGAQIARQDLREAP